MTVQIYRGEEQIEAARQRGEELVQVSPEEVRQILANRAKLARAYKVAAVVHAARRVRARKDKRRNRKADKVAKASRKRNRA